MFIGMSTSDEVIVEQVDGVCLMRGVVNGEPDCFWVTTGGRVLDYDYVGDEQLAREAYEYMTKTAGS